MSAQSSTERLTEPTTREFGGAPVRTVSITVAAGSIAVLASPGATTASVEVHELTGPPVMASWNDGVLKLEQIKDADGQIWGTVKSLFGGAGDAASRPSARLTVSVPDDAAVSVKTVSGEVVAGGSHGPVSVYTASGAVTLDHPTGRVDVATVGGDVDCASPAGELKVKTVSGDITVQDAVLRSASVNTVSGRTILDLRHGPSLLTANSVSGEVSVRMPIGSGYDASVATTSGHVVVDGEVLHEEGKRGGHRYAGDRSVAIKARTVTANVVVLRESRPGENPRTGPVIGEPGPATPRSDVQDEVRPTSDPTTDSATGAGERDAGEGI